MLKQLGITLQNLLHIEVLSNNVLWRTVRVLVDLISSKLLPNGIESLCAPSIVILIIIRVDKGAMNVEVRIVSKVH